MPIRALQIGSAPDANSQPSVGAAEVQELLREMRGREKKM
jgi:hypothetical protein